MVQILKAGGLKTKYPRLFPESWRNCESIKNYKSEDMVMYKKGELKKSPPKTRLFYGITNEAYDFLCAIYDDNATVSRSGRDNADIRITGLEKDKLNLLGIGKGDLLHMTSQEFDAFMEKGTVPQGRMTVMEMRQALLSKKAGGD